MPTTREGLVGSRAGLFTDRQEGSSECVLFTPSSALRGSSVFRNPPPPTFCPPGGHVWTRSGHFIEIRAPPAGGSATLDRTDSAILTSAPFFRVDPLVTATVKGLGDPPVVVYGSSFRISSGGLHKTLTTREGLEESRAALFTAREGSAGCGAWGCAHGRLAEISFRQFTRPCRWDFPGEISWGRGLFLSAVDLRGEAPSLRCSNMPGDGAIGELRTFLPQIGDSVGSRSLPESSCLIFIFRSFRAMLLAPSDREVGDALIFRGKDPVGKDGGREGHLFSSSAGKACLPMSVGRHSQDPGAGCLYTSDDLIFMRGTSLCFPGTTPAGLQVTGSSSCLIWSCLGGEAPVQAPGSLLI